MHNLRFTGAAAGAGSGAGTGAGQSEGAAVDCKFAASISVVACGLVDVSTPGEAGTELTSTVGNNWVALDSSEMLLENKCNKKQRKRMILKALGQPQTVYLNCLPTCCSSCLPYGIGCTQWTMMMRRLVGASHGHASQELLKAAASLCHRLCYCSLILHGGRR